MNTANIASHLPRMARAQPDSLAVAIQKTGESYSYRQLDEASDCLARGLQALGVGKGTRVVLMVKPGLEFFALVFAIFRMGAVLVAVDPGMGIRNLGTCLEEAEPEVFIGIAPAHLARLLFRWCKKRKLILLHAGPWSPLALGMTTLQQLHHLGESASPEAMVDTAAEDPAAILFTSGSTGVPKGVNYSHGNFSAQVEALRQQYAIQPGEVDLATFPLFALFAPALGMTSIIPDMDFTRPGTVKGETIYRAVRDFGVSSMFGSPALLDRVGRWGEGRGKKLAGLKRVITAGAPVSADILQRFAALLDEDARIYTPYGATEALPVSSIDSREILEETAMMTVEGRGICVGRPVDAIDLHIVQISDEVIEHWQDARKLPAGEVGEIVVKGEQVTASYYNRRDSTALAKIYDEGGAFYHRMGDLGYLDEAGRLWFCGRKGERIVCEDRVYFTTCCEGVFDAHAKVKRSALVGVGEAGARRPVLCLELEPGVSQEGLPAELLALGAAHVHTAAIRDFLVHPGFPVDIRHNAKIGRRELARWAEGRC